MHGAALPPILLAIALAGCTAPGPADDDPFQGTCPSWVQGPSLLRFATVFHPESQMTQANDTLRFPQTFRNHTLDRITLDFHPQQDESRGIDIQDARLTLHLVENATGAPVQAYNVRDGPDGPRLDTFTYGPGWHTDFSLRIDLADPGEPVHPRAVDAVWSLERDLDGDPQTVHYAQIHYQALGLYRVCGAD